MVVPRRRVNLDNRPTMNPLSTTSPSTRKAFNWAIGPIDFDADWPQIDRLLSEEDWPFTRDDIALSIGHPDAIALAARKDDELLGFILAHHFGPVAYLDMAIVGHEHRTTRVVVHLWLQASELLSSRGLNSMVSHGTIAGARGLRLLGFQPGRTFTAVRREPGPADRCASDPLVRELAPVDLPALVRLDEAVFGVGREDWLRALFDAINTRHFGRGAVGALEASVGLRERRDGVLYLDTCNAQSFDALQPLIDHVIGQHADHVLECMVALDSDLHRHLLGHGFFVPSRFAEIGPLVEYAGGEQTGIGCAEQVRTLNWF